MTRLVDAYEGEMTMDMALDKIRWATAGSAAHPTSCSQYWRDPTGAVRCTCGLWAALAMVNGSTIGRLLRDAEAGRLPR